ncbi:MAG: hypothetical protein Kow00129_03280 [Thermoleophilia bacterium]
MEPNRHLEAVFRQLIDRCSPDIERSAATQLAEAITEIASDEEAEDIAGIIDDAIHRWERERSGDAETVAEGPGRSGGAI